MNDYYVVVIEKNQLPLC